MTHTTPTAEERAELEEERAFTNACAEVEQFVLKHFGVHLSLRPGAKGLLVHVSGSNLEFSSGLRGEAGGLAITLKVGQP